MGFLCWGGQCVSACNPPCGAGEQCTEGGVCAPFSAAPMGYGAGAGPVVGPGAPAAYGVLSAPPEGDPGWARTAGYMGIGTMVVLGGLTAGIVATNDDADIAIPLGIGATVFGGAMIPVVAVGGGSARRNPSVRGYTGMRIASWIIYGLSLTDAVLAIGLGLSDIEVPAAVVGSVGLLGVLSAGGMTLDAFASASEAASLGRVADADGRGSRGLALSPFVGPVGREPHGMVLGVRGSL